MSKNIQAIYPLTPVQEGILYHTIEQQGSDVYFLQFSCVLNGLEDISRWQQCWTELTQTHSALRTLFTWQGRPMPLQIVRETVELPWLLQDWQCHTELEKTEKWQALVTRDRDQNVELDKAPLLRLSLVTLNQNQHRFLISFHHIMLDGWSLRLLLNEAVNKYNGTHEGCTPKTSFEQFVNYCKQSPSQEQAGFWRNYLQGFTQPTGITLPVRQHTTNCNAKNHKNQALNTLNTEQSEQIRATARQHGFTLNTLFTGAWASVLSMYSQADDVVFGTTVSGRPSDLADANSTVGLFINSLPCRVTFDTQMTVHNWLQRIQGEQIRCRQYEQSPLTQIHKVSELPPGQALFDTLLVVENMPAMTTANATSAKHQLCLTEPDFSEFSHYPIALIVEPTDSITIQLIYQSSDIDRNTAQSILNLYSHMLNMLCRNINQTVSTLATLAPNELNSMQRWNNTTTDFSRSLPCHLQIEHFTFRNAQNTALIDLTTGSESSIQPDTYTYGELNQHANRIAHQLVTAGVQVCDTIPILLNRSANTIISLLAVLKTGANYVILDSELPLQRLRSMLLAFQSDRLIVLTETTLSPLVTAITSQELRLMPLHVDNHAALAQQSNEDLDTIIDTEQLAYTIFTSGTTGKPKGVGVTHRALLNSTKARSEFYNGAPERFLHLSALPTDSAIAGIYWTLCTGNTLILAPKHIEQNCAQLSAVVHQYQVTHMLCIPSLYGIMLEDTDSTLLQSLHTVVVAGEACSASVIKAHQKTLPLAQLINEYGPSEACVWATAADLSHWQPDSPIPIGTPIANTRCYVLDAYQRPVPRGVVGELYIGGDNLADGYTSEPHTTEKHFVEVSIDGLTQHNERLYRTGDKVWQQADGALVFVGRCDEQIKVRGFRVEPEEIECLLNSHPNINTSMVYATDSQISDSQLYNALSELDESQAMDLLAEVEGTK